MNRLAIQLAIVLCTACTTVYPVVPITPQPIGPLQINGIPGWSAVPASFIPVGIDAVWTRNGTNLDSLLVFADVQHGESLFPPPAPHRGAPAFQRDMLAPDIALMVESAFSSRLGEGHARVEVGNIRPMSGNRFRFDINHTASNGFEVRGVVYGGVDGERLWLLVYQGAAQHYFDASLPQVEAVFASVRRRR